jgi:FixJ family two-component response regulator
LDQPSLATQAVWIGAKDFLVKPVQPTRLITSIRKVLR